MTEVLRYLLVLWGVIYLVTQSAIFSPFRIALSRNTVIATLIYCPACFGTWVGFALDSLLPWTPSIGYVESGLAAMALGSIWGRLFGDDSAFRNEYERHAWFKEGERDVGGDDNRDTGRREC